MRRRAILSILLLATATACATPAESPTAPPSLGFVLDAPPPPPPIDTGGMDLEGDVGAFNFDYFSARYFVNKTESIAWITFESGVDTRGTEGTSDDVAVVATPNARLLYNQKAGTTTGTGILTDEDGTTLDLSTVVINKAASDFGACDGTSTFVPGGIRVIDEVVVTSTTSRSPTFCGGANFVGGGYLTATRRVATTPAP